MTDSSVGYEAMTEARSGIYDTLPTYNTLQPGVAATLILALER